MRIGIAPLAGPVAGLVAGLVAVAALTSCSSMETGTPGPTSASSTSTASSPAESSETSPTPSGGEARDLDVDVLVVPPAADRLPSAWEEQFVIGYGRGRELLGTAPGGDSGTLDIGPEYGAPGPDGTWWFLDAAKRRIAHYDHDGGFLGEVRLGRGALVDGRYFQWQLPHVLADGTVVATRQDSQHAWLLLLRDGRLDQVAVDGPFAPTYADGTLLYGSGDGGGLVEVDPRSGSMRPARSFLTPAGTPFTMGVRTRLRLEIGGSSVSLPLRSVSGAQAHVGIQVRAGADDTLHLFLYGAAEDDESLQLVGATQVSPTGQVAEVEALPDPFSEADPGSPAHLVMAPGSSTPMLVYVMPDGVHVYARTG